MSNEIKETTFVLDNLVSSFGRRNPNVLTATNSSKSPSFNELLIQKVREFPELYDQQQRACTDNVERTKIWDRIAFSIDSTIPGEFAKKRWLQMRDRYRKELKLALRDSFRYPPKWSYFKELTWLDPYLKDCFVQAGFTYPFKREPEETVDTERNSESIENNNNGVYVDNNSPVISSNFMLQKMISSVNGGKKFNENNNDTYNEDSLTQALNNNFLTPESRSPIEKINSGEEKGDTVVDRHSPCVVLPRIHKIRKCNASIKRKLNQGIIKSPNVSYCNTQVMPNKNETDSEDTDITKKPKIDDTFYTTLLEWLEDEDFLLTKLIITRLSKLPPNIKKITRRKLFNLLDEAEDSQDC
uniref:MADF domain-containing protein n=1 Tax=Strongyloides venezuelensis TaxID=75913 RepID=A0A0K0F186_STRVS